MTQITSEHLDLYLNDFFSSKTGSEEISFRQGVGIFCAFEDQAFFKEIIEPDALMHKLYLEAEAYILQKINTSV